MTLKLHEFDVEYSGGYIGDHPHRGATNKPREKVALTGKSQKEGPRTTGMLTLKAGSNEEATTGWFRKALDFQPTKKK